MLGSEFEKEIFEHFALRLRGKKVQKILDCVFGMRWKKRGIARDFRCAWLCGKLGCVGIGEMERVEGREGC